MPHLNLREVKGIPMPAPYERTLKILVSPEKEVLSLGLSHPVRFENAITSKSATVGISLFMPGKKLPKHVHNNEEETIYIINGRGKYIVGGEPIDVEPDTIIYVPPGVEHEFSNTGDEMVKQVWFMVKQR